METINNTNENFNDLVFENKNKTYGAYAIRKSYNDNLSVALFSSVSFFGIIAVLMFLFTRNDFTKINLGGQVKFNDSLFIVNVDITPPEKIETEKKKIIPPKDVAPHTDNLTPEVTDKKTDETIAINENAKIVKNGDTKNIDSAAATAVPDIPLPATTSSTKIQNWVDQMPEFDGDFFKFLRTNLVYPRMASENLTSGTVGLTFVVEKDGSIGDIKILNAVADGCTEEAIRVVKLMPKWKPGRSHGELVRVQYNLPVKFRIK